MWSSEISDYLSIYINIMKYLMFKLRDLFSFTFYLKIYNDGVLGFWGAILTEPRLKNIMHCLNF